MPEDREELLQHYRLSREKLLAAIDRLSDAQMSEHSIDGWSVNDHLGHIALWDDLRAAEVERISAGFESAWKITDEQSDTYNAIGYDARRSMSAKQARWELENSRRKLLGAIEQAPPQALDTSLYGDAGVRSTHEEDHAGWLQRWRDEKGY